MVHRYIKLLFALFLFVTYSCNNRLQSGQQNLCAISKFYQPVEKVLLKDTAAIKQSHDKFIQVEGYLSYDFENVAVYPYKWSETSNALWLNFSDNIASSNKELNMLNQKKIILIGRVNINRKGHLGGYMASVDSVFCIQVSDVQ